MIEQVRKNKEILEACKDKRKHKEELLTKKMGTLEELQTKYYEKCKSQNQTPLTYEEFKQKKREKHREEKNQSKAKYSSVSKKQVQTVRDIIHSQFLSATMFEVSEKSVKQLRTKKQIAEGALKNAYRKYEREIEEAESKLQSLRKENESLNTKLLQKKKEK